MPIIPEVDPNSDLASEYRGVAAGGRTDLTQDGDSRVALTLEEALIHAAADNADDDVAREFAKLKALDKITQEVVLPARSHGLI